MACAEVSYFLFAFSAMPQPSQMRAGISQFCATIVEFFLWGQKILEGNALTPDK